MPSTTVTTTMVALALGVLLIASPASATVSSACSLFTTCIDCACSHIGYKITAECKTGCEWQVSTGTCVANGTATGEAYTSLWKNTDTEALWEEIGMSSGSRKKRRLQLVEEGLTTCAVPLADGPIISISVLFVSAGCFQLYFLYAYCSQKKSAREIATAEETRTWLLQSLREHMPEGDSEVWSGTQDVNKKLSKNKVTSGGYFVGAMISFLPLTVPSIVWLGIGLPYIVESNWEFAFYYPSWFVGGMALLGHAAVIGSMCADKNNNNNPKYQLQAYMISSRHVLEAMANTKTHELVKIKSTRIHSVVSVERTGNNTIRFQAAQGGQGANQPTAKLQLSFEGLVHSDAATLFTLLQRLRPQNEPTATLVANELPAASSVLVKGRPAGGDIEMTGGLVVTGSGAGSASAAAPVATTRDGYHPVV